MQEIKTFGIDASLTGTGVAYLIDKKLQRVSLLASKKIGVQRVVDIEDKLKHHIDACPAGLILIEGYAYAAANQAHQIGELGGVIRRMLHRRNVNWIEVAPSQLKKFATGKGNCKKDLVLLNVFKKWGVEFQTNDEADAFVLAMIGQALLGIDIGYGAQYQSEVISELLKKYKEVLPQCS